MNIGEKIHELRKKHRVSSSKLASEVGVPKHIVSAWESGEITPDSVELKKIAQVLNVSVDTLLDKTEYYNNTDLITNMYDDYKEKNKGKFVFLIISFTIIFLIIGDTILALALKRSPIISWKVSYLSGESYIKKGLFMDTYYCFNEQGDQNIIQKFKLSKYECPATKKSENDKTNKQVKSIKDTSSEIEGFRCSTATEKFYEDENYAYYLECTNSSYIIVTYYNDKTENIKRALENGKITINDLDEYKIKYNKKELDNKKEPEPEEPKEESEYPKKEDIPLTDNLTFYIHKNQGSAKALEAVISIEDGKLVITSSETGEKKEIYNEEEVAYIGRRKYGPTGDASLIILTTNGDAYISKQNITYGYEFGDPLSVNKLDFQNITQFKIEWRSELEAMSAGLLIGIDKDGNEKYLKENE